LPNLGSPMVGRITRAGKEKQNEKIIIMLALLCVTALAIRMAISTVRVSMATGGAPAKAMPTTPTAGLCTLSLGTLVGTTAAVPHCSTFGVLRIPPKGEKQYDL